MNSGMVQISEGSVLVLLACVIAESVLINQDAVLIATGTKKRGRDGGGGVEGREESKRGR